jgi:hypothetical protein
VTTGKPEDNRYFVEKIRYHHLMSIRDRYPFVRPCPCGSGASAHECCYSATEAWRKIPRSLSPPGPVTGKSNPKCYLRSTQNCSDKITREHYISRNVLASMEKNGTSKISGTPWQAPQEFRIVSTESLTSKILCKRHNESLSALDSEAGRLIRTIGNYDRGFNDVIPRREMSLFCGEDLERWMLKTVCSMVGGKQVGRGGVARDTEISEKWVSILLEDEDWPPGGGFYAALPSGATYHSSSFSFMPLTHSATGQVVAAQLILNGVSFYLMLGRPDDPTAFGVYRPRTLIFEQHAVEKFIEISWLDDTYEQHIRFSRVGKYDGPPPDWPLWAREG